jgi:hypothetical protein
MFALSPNLSYLIKHQKWIWRGWAWKCISVISITQEADIGGLQFEASMCKKLSRPYLKNNPGMLTHICNPSYSGARGSIIVS